MFGEWDAPVTDDDIPIATPVGAVCVWCESAIREGDNGRITPVGYVEHRECSLRNVFGGIGHLVDHERYCARQHDPDAGLGRRRSSILVWQFFQQTRFERLTPERLAGWRAVIEAALEQTNAPD